MSITEHAFRIRLPDCSKLATHWKITMTSQITDMTSQFFTLPCFSPRVKLLVQVSCQYQYWFGVVVIFVYNGLTRDPKIENIPVWVLPNIWRLKRVRDTTFRTNASNEKLLNDAKSQVYSFYHFWVIKRKPAGE